VPTSRTGSQGSGSARGSAASWSAGARAAAQASAGQRAGLRGDHIELTAPPLRQSCRCVHVVLRRGVGVAVAGEDVGRFLDESAVPVDEVTREYGRACAPACWIDTLLSSPGPGELPTASLGPPEPFRSQGGG